MNNILKSVRSNNALEENEVGNENLASNRNQNTIQGGKEGQAQVVSPINSNRDYDKFDKSKSPEKSTKRNQQNSRKASLPILELNKIQLSMADDNMQIKSAKKACSIAADFQTFELIDIFKSVGLTLDEFEKLSKNRLFTKLTDSIEFLNRIILDKNLYIRVMKEENDSLNIKNTELNNDNMSLGKQLIDMRKELDKVKNKLDDLDNHSLINNTSNITISVNNVNNKISHFST
jgi:hypothetical protein